MPRHAPASARPDRPARTARAHTARAALVPLVVVMTAALAVLTPLTVAAPAGAHNPPPVPSPAEGAELESPPTDVALTFTQQVLDVGTVVEVTGPDGDATHGSPKVDGMVVTQPLADELPAGDYTVAWRVTSEDGHPVDGTWTFTVAAASTPEAPASTPTQVPTPAPAPSATTVAPTTPAPTSGVDLSRGPSDGLRTAYLAIAAAGLTTGMVLLIMRQRQRRG